MTVCAQKNDSSSPEPARVTRKDSTPWVRVRDGVSFQPLRFMGDGSAYAALLRLDPGIGIKLHRHTGRIHAYNLEGSRTLFTGEKVSAGDYVYEPPGNMDSWKADDDGPVTVFIIVEGRVEYLDENGSVTSHASCETQLKAYLQHCTQHGEQPADIVEN